MDEDWENWAVLIRSTLLSSKKPLTPREINRDIKQIDGRNIPYKQMNYSSLEEMLKDIRGVKVFQQNGETVVQAIANEKTLHIQKMIRCQKNSKKKRMLPRASNTFYMNTQSPRINRWNQNNRYNLSAQTNFAPKMTSTPTSEVQKPVQIRQQQQQQQQKQQNHQNHQYHQYYQQQSFKKNGQFAPKPNLEQYLTPSERLLTALLKPVSDSESASASQLLNPSAENQRLTDKIVDPNTYCESRQLDKTVYKVPVNNNCKSYPQEAKTKDETEKLAAEAAFKELNKKSTLVTSDPDLVVKHIVDIVNTQPTDLFDNIDIQGTNGTISNPANYSTNVKAHLDTLLEPENLKLINDQKEFWLQVYNVDNTLSIWGLIIDENHSDKVDELAQEMKVHYDKEVFDASSIAPGKYYAVFDSEWHRVRCIKLDEEGKTATVFFIDRGDQDEFSTSRLRELHKKFYSLPAQAVRLSLAGLKIFEDCEEAQILLTELLVDNSVYARIVRNSERFEMGSYPGDLSAELYLERDGEEINVNHFIRSEILSKIVNPLAFLGPEKLLQEVHISYVDKSAIFIQLKSQGMKFLKSLINKLEKEHLKPTLNFDSSKMYIANIQDEWQRVRIVKIENENIVEVQCVDTGNRLTVMKANLVLLDEVSEILTVYPNQAVQVHLHKITPLMFNEKMVNRLRNLVPKANVFYVKVVDIIQDIPMVEFYKRTDNNYLASLNDTLILESELTSRSDCSSTDAFSGFPLKAPLVPPIGSYFEVHVTVAAHPSSFKIQIIKNLNALQILVEELSRYCESNTYSSFMFSSVKVGNMYAAKCDQSGRWYRVYVSKIISETDCAIYFCDYGDYKVVPMNKLQPLINPFYDLPYQAIKATLYGITPKLKGDWTVNDSYRFNELVAGRTFYAELKSNKKEKSGEMTLGLELIDTTTDVDISIREVLINENRADKL